MTAPTETLGLLQSPSAKEAALWNRDPMFEMLFERTADAIWLYDPLTSRLVDCNPAAVQLIGARSKDQLLQTLPQDVSPPVQPDGQTSVDKAAGIIHLVEEKKAHRFEWVIRKWDGSLVPVEVTSTAMSFGGRTLHVLISRDISERKQAERELRDLTEALEQRVMERTSALSTSEARFRTLVENAPEAIVVLNGDTGRFLFGNEHACRLYGVPIENLGQLTPAEVSPEFQSDGQRSDELAKTKMAEALAGGTPIFEWNHRQQTTDRIISTEVRLIRLPAEGQNLIRASIIDNTERKNGEIALRESVEKFRALFEGSSQGVVLHDENQLLEVNPAAVRILGYDSPNELLGRPPHLFSPPLQPNGERSEIMGQKHIADCLKKGSARFEWLARSANGRHIPLEIALTRINWSGREVIQAFITDISERQRAQMALAESEARFSVAFQASPIFTSIVRVKDHKFVLVNDALVQWLGYSRSEILGKRSVELGIWESQTELAEVWQELLTVGRVRQRECKWRNRRNEAFTILLSAETILLDNELHVLCLDQDITQRKQAENGILKSLAREKQLSELKSNFVSMVSHEFRTPLGIIQSSAELLRDFYTKMSDAERQEQLQSIARNTNRMAAMMESVLVLSRLEVGKLMFRPAPLELHKFFRRIAEEVLAATNNRCPLTMNVENGLPTGAADDQLLGHVFTNLLTNAVKYSEAARNIYLDVKRDGDEMVCVVRDSGIGIAPEDQGQLFNAFYRGSNVGSRPGTGLGLLLVKRCTELHRGNLKLESKIDEGTTVTVRLPVFGAKHEENSGY